MDSDIGKWDQYGFGCKDYTTDSNCGKYDDGDFYSYEMCCICGGGSYRFQWYLHGSTMIDDKKGKPKCGIKYLEDNHLLSTHCYILHTFLFNMHYYLAKIWILELMIITVAKIVNCEKNYCE